MKNNFNQKKISRHIKYIDEKIEAYEKQLDEEDDEQDHQKLKDKIDSQKQKRQNYQDLQTRLKETGEAQISLTDPDAKAVVLHRNIVNVGYNIQAASDQKHKLFVQTDTGWVNDTHDLAPVAIACKELLVKDSMIALADKGYNTGEQLQTCKDHNITTYVAPKGSSTPGKDCISIEEFQYDYNKDTYTCPVGKLLKSNGNFYQKGSYKIKQYKTKACKDYSIRSRCTQNKTGRLIERSEYQDVIEENRDRVLAAPDYYRERQRITEHQFGTLKRQWGFTHTLLKGKENVLSEVYLLLTIYNLRRSISILGGDELKRRLRNLMDIFFHKIPLFRFILSLFIKNTKYPVD